jgi:hypothetical protein
MKAVPPFRHPPSTDQLKERDAIIPARDRFAIQYARPGAQPAKGLDDQREAVREVVAGEADRGLAPQVFARACSYAAKTNSP